jgi:hypothetical protein
MEINEIEKIEIEKIEINTIYPIKCIVDKCQKEGNFKKMCFSHYKKSLIYGDPNFLENRICEFIDCENKAYKSKRCKKHHVPQLVKICTNDNCNKIQIAKGLCAKHYDIAKKTT